MGKSPSSCFKIISCAADSSNADDDLEHSENKQSSDKRRWSFRKKSARHQVPSNTVISEPQFVGFNKENPEATTDKFYSVKNSSVPEKSQIVEQENVTKPLSLAVTNSEETILREQMNEAAPLSSVLINSEIPPVVWQANETAPSSSAVVNSDVAAVSDTSDVTTYVDADLQENVIIIQVAARRFLARREIQKVKNVIKLQSAVRGHLVRRQAIGTLRCVQAIVKMQSLVRARHARQGQLLEKSSGREKNDEKFRTDSWNPDFKSNQTKHAFHAVEKLLSNRFARQLLESSASKTKPIYISCDPLRHDSAWQWLEKWMDVTSSKVGQQQELNWVQGCSGEMENSSSACEEVVAIPVAEPSVFSGSNLSPGKVEGEKDSDADTFGKFESHASSIVSDQCIGFSAQGNKEQCLGEGDIEIKEENMTQTVGGKEASGVGLQSEHDNYLNNSDSVTENLMHDNNTKIVPSEPMENEAKKFDFGTRKIRNPAFAAVQAKFEELSSTPKSSSSVSIESKPNPSQVVSMAKNKDFSYVGNTNIQNPIIQVATSECGTEISISSTLDSPDRSEPGTDDGEIVIEVGTSRVAKHNMNDGVSETFRLESMKSEANMVSTASNEFNEETSREDNQNIANSIAAVDSEMVENQQENLNPQAYEGSPMSNVVATESRDTPSSQLSVQSTKTLKTPNNIIARKMKSKSGSKSSPSNVKNDSEHLPKDIKNANKRSSAGIAKLDNEPRRSSSSCSLPSYMQATESARAKAHGSISLKSSPDVQEKDDSLKKRHSLPIGDEKQGSSPRVQRSTSQTQQSLKHNNNHSPQSSAERRWQR